MAVALPAVEQRVSAAAAAVVARQADVTRDIVELLTREIPALRDDDEIRGIALQSLIWDVEVPADAVNVKVDDGWVTLTGNVSYQFESNAAYEDVAGLYGVVGVTNEIRVTNP